MGASCGDGGCCQAGGWRTRIPRASWQLPALQSGGLSFPGAGTRRRQAGRPPNVPSAAGDGLAPAAQAAVPAAPQLHRGIELSPRNSPKWAPGQTPTSACFLPRISPRFAPCLGPGVQARSTTGIFRDASQSQEWGPARSWVPQPLRTPNTIISPPSVLPSPAGAAAASRAASAAGWRN